jgi:uncharacterized phiE125 gp8 family phage protein
MAKIKIIARDIEAVLPLAALYRQCEIVATDVDSDGVESHPDDQLLRDALEAAVDMAEEFTGLTLALTTYEMALDDFPCMPHGRWGMSAADRLAAQAIELPRPPFIAIVEFVASDDSDGGVDPATYTLDDFSALARLIPVSAWPTGTPATNRIRVRWLAGYGDSSDGAQPLPAAIRQALLMLVAHWYENRAAVAIGSAAGEMPIGVQDLLRPKRVRLGMA